MKHLLKHEYPNLKGSDYLTALSFIDGRCSQYYFLNFMRCSNGNVDDAIRFYIFDDEFRSLLFKYLIRFEVQSKADFIQTVEEATRCKMFWKKKKFYLEDAIHRRVRGRHSKYYLLIKKIKSNISRMHFSTIGPIDHAAMYVSTYGTFQELFKCIKPVYKQEFIDRYASCLTTPDYHLLNSFFEGIRIVRNRCAHGNHIISKKTDKDLEKLKFKVVRKNIINVNVPVTLLEGIIIYLYYELLSGKEFIRDLRNLIVEYMDLFEKYDKRISLSKNTYFICCELLYK